MLGALAGAGGLALASIVYYDGVPTPRAIVWTSIGVLVGGAAGAAGAAWRLRRDTLVGTLAVAALGLSLAAEGVARLSGGLFMDSRPSSVLAVLFVTGAGVLLPLAVAKEAATGVVAAIAVVTLALPVATVLIVLPRLVSA